MLASLPEMNDKISVSINMGASVFMKYIKAPFLGAYARKRNDKVRGVVWSAGVAREGVSRQSPRCVGAGVCALPEASRQPPPALRVSAS
jgi:hypothetical protein